MASFYVSIAPIVENIGIELRKNFGKIEALAFKGASHGSAVTELDRKTEQLLAEQLHKIYPDIEFFGEEFGGDDKAQRFWLVDPIDGTSNFIRGLPFCATMVTLIENGHPVFTIIYNFITKEMYSAEKGKGARMNGNLIHVNKREAHHAAVFMETNKTKKGNLDKYILVNEKFTIYRTLSAGFEYSAVASGKLEARIALDPHGEDWDYAPGALLVSEAGGVVKNIGTNSYDYKNHNFIAGNIAVCDELVDLLG